MIRSRIEDKLSGRFNISDRIACKQWDSFAGDGEDSGGSGDALTSILSAVTAGASVYAASQGQGVPYGTQPYAAPPSPIYNNAYSAHATTSNSSLLWIVILAVIGFFAFSQLNK